MRLGLVMEGFFGAFLHYFGSLGTPFGLISPFLGCFWGSFWVSQGALGLHLGRLWASFWIPQAALTPSWLKLTQDGEKTRFFQFPEIIWVPDWDPKINKNR